MPIDPILSLLVAALLLKSAWQLTRRSAHILLEGSPEWLDVKEMREKIIANIPTITDIHHVHVWGLTPQHPILTMHVALQEQPDNPTVIVRRIKTFLEEEFGVSHSTIEIEIDDCADT